MQSLMSPKAVQRCRRHDDLARTPGIDDEVDVLADEVAGAAHDLRLGEPIVAPVLGRDDADAEIGPELDYLSIHRTLRCVLTRRRDAIAARLPIPSLEFVTGAPRAL
jgi:hypothetical protein